MYSNWKIREINRQFDELGAKLQAEAGSSITKYDPFERQVVYGVSKQMDNQKCDENEKGEYGNNYWKEHLNYEMSLRPVNMEAGAL